MGHDATSCSGGMQNGAYPLGYYFMITAVKAVECPWSLLWPRSILVRFYRTNMMEGMAG